MVQDACGAMPFTMAFKQTMTENKASCKNSTILSHWRADVQSRTIVMDKFGLIAVVYTVYRYLRSTLLGPIWQKQR